MLDTPRIIAPQTSLLLSVSRRERQRHFCRATLYSTKSTTKIMKSHCMFNSFLKCEEENYLETMGKQNIHRHVFLFYSVKLQPSCEFRFITYASGVAVLTFMYTNHLNQMAKNQNWKNVGFQETFHVPKFFFSFLSFV